MTAPARIGIIGSGPMGTYLLQHLTAHPDPLDITVIEAESLAGPGMPYRAGTNAPYMLCNAFSREIPPIGPTLADWLRDLPEGRLADWGLTPGDISSRDFYPRVLLGQYLRAGFLVVCEAARVAGHRVTVLTGTRATDVLPRDGGAGVAVEGRDGARILAFDRVAIATGHDWPAAPRIGGATLVSPWPHGNVTALPPGRIGILGSALSAVDVAVALGHAHGRFAEGEGRVTWTPGRGAEGLRVTMVSKQGILPEADFWYPHLYEPLRHVTDAAMAAEIAQGPDGLLDRAFAVLWRELAEDDPAFAADLALDPPAPETFADGYFARRRRLGAFRALREGLREARDTMRRRETIPFRYALLRGHAPFDALLPHLTAGDLDRFRAHLLPVFADAYAAVPHLSLERIAAMHEAGALDILASGEDAGFADRPGGGVRVAIGEATYAFDAMVDARGQAPAKAGDLPFPTLVAALADPDAPVDAPPALALGGGAPSAVLCLALPQLLERHPFAQGLAECHELAGRAAAVLLETGDAAAAPRVASGVDSGANPADPPSRWFRQAEGRAG